jgi:hypothetical protein
LATIPPHPFYIGERDDDYDFAESLFDPDSMWFVRPQLFFHCTLRPIGTVAGSYNSSDKDIPLDLVFFSPFEELRLRTAGIMESVTLAIPGKTTTRVFYDIILKPFYIINIII